MSNTELRMTARDIPISAIFSKNPSEKRVMSQIVGVDLRFWDFIFWIEDDRGNPTKVWASSFSGDRPRCWTDDRFDYELEDEVQVVWEKKIV